MEIADGRGPALTGRLDSVDTYNPASYRGGILRLHYARAQELEPWLDLVAVRGEVVVQFWLKPGEAAARIAFHRKVRATHRSASGGCKQGISPPQLSALTPDSTKRN